MALLEIDHLSLRFDRGKRQDELPPPTLEDVSLSVRDGEFVTLLGPSGCGKTTLLRIVAGLEHPTEGTIAFQDGPIKSPGSDRVMVFQQPWLYPWLSVRDNVAFGLKLHDRKIDWEKVDEMIEIVGLTRFAKYRPYELSGGMQQRAALARALVMSPKMLLMDEPFGALDAQTRRTMQEFLLGLWEQLRLAVMFVTHDVEEAILLGDRSFVMGTSPGCIALELAISLPRPRNEQMILDPHFLDLRRQALECLRSVALKATGIVTAAPDSGPEQGPESSGAAGEKPSVPAPH